MNTLRPDPRAGRDAGSPHEVAVTADGIAYVTNHGSAQDPGHTLTMLDLRRRAVLRTIELGTYMRPHGITLSRDHRSLWVTCEAARAVIEIDAANGTLMQDWGTRQDGSHMVVASADEHKLYVANAGSGSCSVIDRSTGKVVVVPSGAGAEGIDYVPGRGEVWIANRESNDLVVLDARSDTVLARIAHTGSQPVRVRCTPEGHEAWVANARSNDVSAYDTATRMPLATIPLGAAAVAIAIEPSGQRAFVATAGSNQITVIDVRTRKVLKTIGIGRGPDGMAWVRGIK